MELLRNHLYTHAHNVLARGPVREQFAKQTAGLFPILKAQLPPEIVSSLLFDAESITLAGGSILISEHNWSELLEDLWMDALIRLLLSVFQNQQGGTVLVTPNGAANHSYEDGLTIPYATAYSQLRLVLEQRFLFAITQYVLSAKSLSEWSRPLGEMPPDDQALQEPDLMAGPPGNDQEIQQAAAFIASLARFEGFLVLTPHLDLNGFGGQPGSEAAPDEVYLAADELAAEAELTAISYRSFGPRNQALIRQCCQDHEAIAFAFTQDGDLRAMMWRDGKVIVWNRVRLRRL